MVQFFWWGLPIQSEDVYLHGYQQDQKRVGGSLMIYHGLSADVVNAGFRLLRLSSKLIKLNRLFYKFKFQGWELMILPPSKKGNQLP